MRLALRRPATRTVHVLVPSDIHDPARPSGGNHYDQRLLAGLRQTGWRPHAVLVPQGTDTHGGSAGGSAGSNVHQALSAVPDDAIVLVDGLLTHGAPAAVTAAAARLRLVVLVHLPLGHRPPGHSAPGAAAEREVLLAARAVIVTSHWCRDLLLRLYPLDPNVVVVASPGVDPAPLTAARETGERLLCVAAVARHKGHHVLLEALAELSDLPWHLECVGSLSREPGFAADLRERAAELGLAGRVGFPGALVGRRLAVAYARSDVLVLPTRVETYGMVVTEALARGLPVIASSVGGVPEALGRALTGRPGLLLPPEDPAALAAALRRWLTDAALRRELRQAAEERRRDLGSWEQTADHVSVVLHGLGR